MGIGTRKRNATSTRGGGRSNLTWRTGLRTVKMGRNIAAADGNATDGRGGGGEEREVNEGGDPAVAVASAPPRRRRWRRRHSTIATMGGSDP